jgi:hypothetical protein
MCNNYSYKDNRRGQLKSGKPGDSEGKKQEARSPLSFPALLYFISVLFQVISPGKIACEDE